MYVYVHVYEVVCVCVWVGVFVRDCVSMYQPAYVSQFVGVNGRNSLIWWAAAAMRYVFVLSSPGILCFHSAI